MRYIKLKHEVVRARYDAPTGKWHIRIRRPIEDAPEAEEYEEFDDVADVLVTAFGAISRWKMPDIEGMETFKGELHHTAGFNPEEKTWIEASEKWKDKRVGVIGVVRTTSSAVSLGCTWFSSRTDLAVSAGFDGDTGRVGDTAQGETARQLRSRSDVARVAVW